MKKTFSYSKKNKKQEEIKEENNKTYEFSKMKIEDLYTHFNSSAYGMNDEARENSFSKYGSNEIRSSAKENIFVKLFKAFINPFTLILLVLAVVSIFTDIVFADIEDKNYMTVIVITAMVLISGVMKFVQETRSGNSANKLLKMIHTTACVERIYEGKKEIDISQIVCGDIIHLSAGDMIPADIRIIEAKDLFVSQSSLTGESEPVEKTQWQNKCSSAADLSNIAYMGCNVISGTAKAIVIKNGLNTMIGKISKGLTAKKPKSTFEKGINSVSFVLIKFMLLMVPIVLCINGFTKGDWLNASLFAISIAIGLTPEMLPMIVTTSLAKGATAMGKKKVIVKNLNSIQNLGSIDILCTDKTGTLTEDKVILEYHLNIEGNEDERVLKHAYLNSYYQTGLKNLIDLAVISKFEQNGDIRNSYEKIDEIPFDFSRRRMSVVVKDKSGKEQIITKGAVEEMINCCSFADIKGKTISLKHEIRTYILKKVADLNQNGMRVLAVAHKTNPNKDGSFTINDESNMVLIGFLAFYDPPKKSAEKAIKALNEHGVRIKVLTGDNEKVTVSVCKKVGIPYDNIVLGNEIDSLSDKELERVVEKANIFAKLSPEQKARIVISLKNCNHSVGFMGDGINDALAMKVSDIGISVDTAVDIAKESADVILLKKDLNVLEDGIIEGRKTYANMIKYIKMTASSNFGNMFSVLFASIFLPFLPMASIQLILLNLIYDISCTAIPWDNVDPEFLKKPKKWDASSITSFMLIMGPTSSIFDITTYCLMYYLICPSLCGGQMFSEITDPQTLALFISIFQTGRFVESMWSQTLVIHMIRTPKIPFIQSRASWQVTSLTFLGIVLLTSIPYTPLAKTFNLVSLPVNYFGWLCLTIILYMIVATLFKKLYIHKFKELL